MRALGIVCAISLSLVTTTGWRAAATGDGATQEAPPTFRVDPSWPKLPNGWSLGETAAVAVDSRDHVWILHRPRTVTSGSTPAPAVLEFDAAGKFVQGWGGPGDSYEWPDTEHTLAVDASDHVWVGGNNPIATQPMSQRWDDMLLKFTRTGSFVLQIGHRDQSKGNRDTSNLHAPADLHVDTARNEAIVADGYGNRRVVVLDASTGAFKRMWGAFGNTPEDVASPLPAPAPAAGQPATPPPAPPLDTDGPGAPQFGIVHGLKVSKDGLVYVADRGNRRVQVFTLDGKFVTQGFINRAGPSPNSAAGVAFSPDAEQRYLYVADYGNSQVLVLERKSLQVLRTFGQRSEKPGDFAGLHQIAADSRGNLYTAEVAPGRRAQRFVVQGASSAR